MLKEIFKKYFGNWNSLKNYLEEHFNLCLLLQVVKLQVEMLPFQKI